MQERHPALDPIIQMDTAAVHDGRALEHLLDADVHPVLVELEAPISEGLGARVMTAARARGKNEDANLLHRSTAPEIPCQRSPKQPLGDEPGQKRRQPSLKECATAHDPRAHAPQRVAQIPGGTLGFRGVL
jgi:hypothetical protein